MRQFLCTHVTEAAPHHLELIDQLFVQGAHFWVHQLLMHCQADSKNVNLWETDEASLKTFLMCEESGDILSPHSFYPVYPVSCSSGQSVYYLLLLFLWG